MTGSHDTLELERGTVTVVRLNRPAASNALNTRMGEELVACFEALAMDPGPARCVILTGAGEKAFCAGGDLKERRGMTDAAWRAQHLVFERMVRALLDCPLPIIGAINGAAYGGGCEIAGCCDFLYAAETARFAPTEVTLGMLPGGGGTQTLPGALGERGRGLQMPLRDGLAFEIEAYSRTVPTADRHEGVLAFNEKRKPRFEGR